MASLGAYVTYITPFCTTPLVCLNSSREAAGQLARLALQRCCQQRSRDAAVKKNMQADPDKWDDSELINAVRRGLENLDAGAAAGRRTRWPRRTRASPRCSRRPSQQQLRHGRLAGQGPDRRREYGSGSPSRPAPPPPAAPPPLPPVPPAGADAAGLHDVLASWYYAGYYAGATTASRKPRKVGVVLRRHRAVLRRGVRVVAVTRHQRRMIGDVIVEQAASVRPAGLELREVVSVDLGERPHLDAVAPLEDGSGSRRRPRFTPTAPMIKRAAWTVAWWKFATRTPSSAHGATTTGPRIWVAMPVGHLFVLHFRAWMHPKANIMPRARSLWHRHLKQAF